MDSTDAKLAISNITNEQFASYLSLRALNFETGEYAEDVCLSGPAAKEIADRLRVLVSKEIEEGFYLGLQRGWHGGV